MAMLFIPKKNLGENRYPQGAPHPTLTGEQIRYIMRVNKITIKRAAALFNITQKRVREVREKGVTGETYVWEWSDWLIKRHQQA